MNPLRLAIMASGRGSNAKALMQWCALRSDVQVECVISDKKDALVLEMAKNFDVPAYAFPVTKAEKSAQEQLILKTLKKHKTQWILLAGYMRLLSPEFLRHFYDDELKQNRVLNIHPSLLPLFPGLDAYEQSFKSEEKQGGVTVHFVDSGMDTGKIMIQQSLPKQAGESLADFKQRGLSLEHQLYPQALEKILTRSL